jgi:hemolysin D
MTAHELDFLPAAVEIQERPPSPVGRAVIWSIVAFFGIGIVWAVIGEIDIVASAQGKIVPSGRVKVIQPLEIGVVRSIQVHEGERVQAGDLLIELDPTATRADLDRLEMELRDARLDRARFRQLERMTVDAAADPEQPRTVALELSTEAGREVDATAKSLQDRLLKSAWFEHRARLAALDNTIVSREAQLAALRDDVKKLEGTLPLITKRADALKRLLAKKLAAEQTWLELEEQRIGQRQELAAQTDRTRQVEASIREARQQRNALEAEFRHRLLDKLSTTDRRIDQLQQDRLKAIQRTELQHLRAPVAGVVQQLAVHTVGGVVTPAQELMKIVPESENLEVEAWILNRDIGFIEAGQAADIKIETFPFTKYGTIDAEVIDVSNDAVSDDRRGLVYAGRVMMKQSAIQVGNRRVNLTPGMAVTVEVKTGKRRLIEYVLSPLLRYKQESLGER